MRKVVAFLVAQVFLITGGTLYLAPVVIKTTYTDWKSPDVQDRGFKRNEDGRLVIDGRTKMAVRDIAVSWPEDQALGRFYKHHEFDWQFGHWSFFWFAFAFVVVAAGVLAVISDGPRLLVGSLISVHVVLLIVAGIYSDVLGETKNPDALEVMFMHDTVLKDVVLKSYDNTLAILWLFVGIVGFVAFDVVAGIVGVLLGFAVNDFVWDPLMRLTDRIEKARIRVKREELGLPADAMFLKIARDSAVVQRAIITVRWRPWPKPHVSYQTTATMPAADLFKAAVAQIRDVDPRVIAEEIATRVADGLVATEAATKLRDHVLTDLQDVLQEKARMGTLLANKKRTDEAQALLQEVSDAKLARFQEDLLAGALETASDELAPFKRTVLDSLRGRVIDTLATVNSGLSTMLPVGTRFVGTHGALTLVVMEQQPMVRTLRWTKDSLEGELKNLRAGGAVVTPDMEEHIKNPLFHVALPYMVYILQFHGNQYVSMRLFCRTEPLKSVNDELSVPPLPNLDVSGQVCLGNSFKTPTGSIAEVAEAVMAYYWDSEFNLHGMDRLYLQARKIHPALRHIWAWEQFSRDNPRFALEVDYWHPTDEKTVADFWKSVTNEAVKTEMMTYDALVARAMDDGEAKLRDAVRGFISAVSTKKRYTRVAIETLGKTLKKIAGEMADAVNGDIRQVGTPGKDAGIHAAFRGELRSVVLNRVMRERKELGAGARFYFREGSEWLRDIVLKQGERR